MNQNLKLTYSKSLLKQAALVGLVVLSSSTVFAIPSDRNQPISLLADRATYNEKTGITTYTGNVIIEQTAKEKSVPLRLQGVLHAFSSKQM